MPPGAHRILTMEENAIHLPLGEKTALQTCWELVILRAYWSSCLEQGVACSLSP